MRHIMTRGRRPRLAAGLLALLLATAAAACGSDDGGASGGGGGDTITLGIIPSWTDGLATAHLWQHVLEDEGYDVEIEEIAEAAPLYTGVANGDIDVYPSAWPEVTHASYMKEYGDDLEDLGAYYEGAKLTFAVPKYVDLDSIEELKDNSERFDSKIIGIEPGAGLTKVTKDSVIPDYGLDDAGFKLVESSTTAMLAELKQAVAGKEDIVVTLWRPFWANSEFPVKDLEDPKNALGEPETLNAIATKGFSDEQPEVAKMFGNLKLTDEQYGSLENLVVNEYGAGKEAEAVDAWLKENPDFADSLKG
jgi:glycine betaine/proline transport system substrate-binding protein